MPLRRLAGGALGRAAGAFTRVADAAADGARAARFLRGRFEMDPRDDDVYVASYPRSGTTWTQMILHFLLTDGAVDFDHLGQVQPWFERSLALGRRTAAELDELPPPRVFKSHLPRRWLPDRGRFVYVERDPGDVVVSYYHFYRSHLGYRGSFDDFFERFLTGDVQYRTWAAHVEGWRRFEGDPNVCWLSYEAMHADHAGAVRTLAAFLGVDVSEERVQQVVAKTRFDAMKAYESKLDPMTEELIERGHLGGRFLRAGRRGGRAALSDEQAQRLRSVPPPSRPDFELHLASFLH